VIKILGVKIVGSVRSDASCFV